MSLSKIANPLTFGPGYWWVLHVDAYDAKTPEDISYFLKRIRPRLESIPCAKCREHALKYLENNPPQAFITIQDGLFEWTWRFHNFANQNKDVPTPTISLKEAIAIYSSRTKCQNCTNPEAETYDFRNIPSYPVRGVQQVLIRPVIK